MSEKNSGTLHIGREPFKKCILGKQWSYHFVGPVAAQRHNMKGLFFTHTLITYGYCTTLVLLVKDYLSTPSHIPYVRGTTPLGRGTRILT